MALLQQYIIPLQLWMLPHKLQTLKEHAGNRVLDQRTEREQGSGSEN